MILQINLINFILEVMSDFYDMVLKGDNPNAAGINERSAREIREGGAAAGAKQIHEGGAASTAPVADQTFKFLKSFYCSTWCCKSFWSDGSPIAKC